MMGKTPGEGGEWLFPETADNINISLDRATSAPLQSVW